MKLANQEILDLARAETGPLSVLTDSQKASLYMWLLVFENPVAENRVRYYVSSTLRARWEDVVPLLVVTVEGGQRFYSWNHAFDPIVGDDVD